MNEIKYSTQTDESVVRACRMIEQAEAVPSLDRLDKAPVEAVTAHTRFARQPVE